MPRLRSLNHLLVKHFLLIAVAPLLLGAIFSYAFLAEDFREDVRERNETLVQVRTEQCRALLVRHLALLQLFGRVLRKSGFQTGVQYVLPDDAAGPRELWESVYLLDRDGKVRNIWFAQAFAQVREDYVELDLSAQDFFSKAVKSSGPLWSEAFLSLVSGQRSLTLTIPQGDSWLAANLNIERLYQEIVRSPLRDDLVFAIIDRSGKVIFHPDQSLVTQQVHLFPANFFDTDSPGALSTHQFDYNGVSYLGSCCLLEETGWRIVIYQPRQEALKNINVLAMVIFASLIVAGSIAYWVSLVLSRKISTPFSWLSAEALKISGGDYDFTATRDPFYREAAHLVTALASMANTIKARENSLLDAHARVEAARNDLEQQVCQRTAALQQSEEKFKTVADFTYDWEYWLDRNGKILYTSPSCERVSGYGPAEFLRDPTLLGAIVFQADQHMFFRHLKDIHQQNEACAMEFRIRTKSGEVRWIEHVCQPVFDAVGRNIGRRGSNKDITGRKNIEHELSRVKNALDKTLDCVFMFHANTLKFFYVNQGAIDHFGYSHEELTAMTPLDVKPEFTLDSFRETIAPLCEQKVLSTTFETMHKHKDGHVVPVEVFLQYITQVAHDNDGGLFVAIVRDITERKSTEDQLRKLADTKSVLLREVNHRVKNNLTAIIAMLHKEADRAEDEGETASMDRLLEVVGRVSGLLTVHRLLSESEWSPLSLKEIAEKIIQDALKATTIDKVITYTISGADALVNSDQAHYLAITLNELTTNTIKYATQGRPSAHVDVSIEPLGSRIQVTYRDDGAGYPDDILGGKIPGHGIGLELIHGIIISSLAGEVRLTNHDGAVTEIMIPAEIY